jgi:uncharacterized membrane protein YkvA (DUF1232 family)
VVTVEANEFPLSAIASGVPGRIFLSPIDLIPGFIPVIGYFDDLLLVSSGLTLVVQLTHPSAGRLAKRDELKVQVT